MKFWCLAGCALLVIGCGGGSNDNAPTSRSSPTASSTPSASATPSPPINTPSPEPTPTPIAITLHELVENDNAKAAARFLTQATFGVTEQSLARLMEDANHYENWIDGQMRVEQTPLLSRVDERIRSAGIDPLTKFDNELAYPKTLLASDVLWETFVYGDDQLRQRVAFALSQIFVISEVSDTLFHDARGIANYHDILASHAFGNFRDLLEAVTLNPMMGEYLSMVRNEKADADRNIRPDENFARELMQLFSIGLVMLNNDGTEQLDESGQPIPTYDQEVIKNFARVFTGWMYGDAPRWYWWDWNATSEVLPMIAFEAFHDTEPKLLLNSQFLSGGQSAQQDLGDALDNIFAHQNVAPFISKQLIQRLVTSNPSAAYVERVANTFNDNGTGVKGDLGAVVKAILLDEEARTGHVTMTNSFGKLKEPVLKFTALMRAFDVIGEQPIDESGSQVIDTLRFYWPMKQMGQAPYGSPSVFNFYRPDFSPAGEIRNQSLVAPEFQILNEDKITSQSNFATQIVFNSYDFVLEDCRPNLHYLQGIGCLAPDFSDEELIADNTQDLIDHVNLLMMAGEMSVPMQDIMAVLIEQQANALFKVAEAVHLTFLSPEFSVQR